MDRRIWGLGSRSFAKATDRERVIGFEGDGLRQDYGSRAGNWVWRQWCFAEVSDQKGRGSPFWFFPLKYSGERVNGEQLKLSVIGNQNQVIGKVVLRSLGFGDTLFQ